MRRFRSDVKDECGETKCETCVIRRTEFDQGCDYFTGYVEGMVSTALDAGLTPDMIRSIVEAQLARGSQRWGP